MKNLETIIKNLPGYQSVLDKMAMMLNHGFDETIVQLEAYKFIKEELQKSSNIELAKKCFPKSTEINFSNIPKDSADILKDKYSVDELENGIILHVGNKNTDYLFFPKIKKNKA